MYIIAKMNRLCIYALCLSSGSKYYNAIERKRLLIFIFLLIISGKNLIKYGAITNNELHIHIVIILLLKEMHQ